MYQHQQIRWLLKCCRVDKYSDRLSELHAMKTEYQAGLWNVNSVMLGGLGKDLQLDEGQHHSSVLIDDDDDGGVSIFTCSKI